MKITELKKKLEQSLEAAEALYEQKGLEKIRLEGEFAAFNEVLGWLNEKSDKPAGRSGKKSTGK